MPRKAAEPVQEAPPETKPLPPFVGQRHVIEYFQRLGRDHLAHAYLFTGPRGVGKRTFATMLAMTLHCERPSGFPVGYDGTCGACRRAFAGSSGDTIVISEEFIRESDRLAGKGSEARKTDVMGIETSRRIIQLMHMHSYEGGRLVCIVPDFDFVTKDEVYNALLKELEEPNPGKLFLLTAERPDRVLPTIRSRLSTVRFGTLTEAEIAQQLERHYGQTQDHARVLARRAQGSLGDAIAQLDEDVQSLRQETRDWALQCLQKPKQVAVTPALSRDEAREQIIEVLRDSRLAVRDVLMIALDSEDKVLDRESIAAYRNTVKALGERAAQKAISALSAVNEAARIADETNIPPSTVLGWLQVQLRSAAA